MLLSSALRAYGRPRQGTRCRGMMISQPPRTPADLLFRLLRWDGPRVGPEELAALGMEGWQALVALAAERAVAPLLRQRLREAGLHTLAPRETQGLLEATYQVTALRTMRIYADLARIARLADDIPLALLKGPALAAPIYGNVALRTIGDLDLLVAEDQVGRLARRLEEGGYRPLEHADEAAVLPHHLPPYVNPSAACPVEIHWQLTRPDAPYAIPIAEIRGRLVRLSLPGCEALGLAPEDLLIYLAVHATYHHDLIGVGPRPLCDIAQLIAVRGAALDWEAIVERAARWRCGRGLALALALAADLVGAAVPPPVLTALGAEQIGADLRAAAGEQLLSTYAERAAMPAPLATLGDDSGLTARIRLVWRRIFVPRAELAAQFHTNPRSPWITGLYLRRAWLLLRRHGGAALALAQGAPEVQAQARRRGLLAAWLHKGG